jgi:pimeloyl-ACP methyl ester carboxylesterase
VEAEPVELPFTGLDDDVAVVRTAIEAAGPDVVVCGHSYGGSVISAAARRLPVRHLVYLCAFMVDEDEDAMANWLSEPARCTGRSSMSTAGWVSIPSRPASVSTPMRPDAERSATTSWSACLMVV